MIIDFLSFPMSKPIEKNIKNLNFSDVQNYIDSKIKHKLISYNVLCIENENFFFNSNFDDFQKKNISNYGFIVLIDPKNPNNFSLIDRVNELESVKGIVFHPYLHDISNSNLDNISKIISNLKEEAFVGVFTAYGSKKIYNVFPLYIANEILKICQSRNFILYHAGGAKILDAYLIAEMWNNVYLDTSFSISYWKNSTIEKDISFVINRIGSNRIIFGSDHPFIDVRKSIDDHNLFFEKYDFSKELRNNIFYNNAKKVLNIK